MVDNKEIKQSIEDMMKGLQGLVAFTESQTKNVFENMGKAEAKKFAKTMEQMKFSDTITNLKKEVEGLKKTFNTMK
jgi:phage-related protein